MSLLKSFQELMKLIISVNILRIFFTAKTVLEYLTPAERHIYT